MTNRFWYAIFFVLMAGAVMSVLRFDYALRQAGPYSERADVKVVVVLGLLLSHGIVASAGAFAASMLHQVKWKWLRITAVATLALITHWLFLLAPAFAALVLLAVCQVQSICPDYANPMAWAFTGTRVPEPVYYASPLVAVISVFIGYRAQHSTAFR